MLIRKIISVGLICSATFFGNILDGGSETKSNKYMNFYFIDPHVDWGNLYIEGVDADFKAAVLAQKKLKGGYFDENLHSVVPADFSQVNQEWHKVKDEIVHLMGPLPSSLEQNFVKWENSARRVDELLQDAREASLFFKKDFQNIASRTKSSINFGPEDQFMIKTRESLVSKVERDAKAEGILEKEAIAKIGDALRGTIVVDEIYKIPQVIAEIIQDSQSRGTQVSFKNVWIEDRDSGYVGIHAKILYPLSNSKEQSEPRYVLAEMQIHLDSMVDGTEASAKERTHLIYEYVRANSTLNSDKLSATSKLLFLAAMEDTLGKSET